MKLPVRLRLTGVFAALLAIVLAGSGAFVYLRFRAERDAAINTELQSRIAEVIAAQRAGAADDVVAALLGSGDDRFGQVITPDGRIQVRSLRLPTNLVLPSATKSPLNTFLRFGAEYNHIRVLARPSPTGTVIVASALDDRDDALRRLWKLLAIGGAGTWVVATLFAWVLAGAALRPVERMRREAGTYSMAEPARRIAVPAANDELHRLAVTLNEMLDTIQHSLEQQRAFVDHASHELRTPLTNLTTELELALRRDRDLPELREAIRLAIEEAQRLNRLASDLLVLARTTGGKVPIARQPTDLANLLRETAAAFTARAASAGVTIRPEFDRVDPVEVDPVRIRQAVSNLLDNALRASPPGGTIVLALHHSQRAVTIAVSDTGPGFPEGLAQHAFEAFVRGSEWSQHGTEGAGLGLAIVAGIVRAHGGAAHITTTAHGTTVTLDLPLPSDDAP